MSFSLLKFLGFGHKENSAVLALHDDFIQVAQMDVKGHLLGFNETVLEKGVIAEGVIKEQGIFKDALAALFKGALPHPIDANRLVINVPHERLYPFVRDFSGNIPEDTLKAEMADYIRKNCPVPLEELNLAYEKRQSSFGAIGVPRDFEEVMKRLAENLGTNFAEFIPEPYAQVAVLPEVPAGDFALFSFEGQKVSISLFHNGLFYDSFSHDEVIDAKNPHCGGCHEAFEEVRQDFQARFNQPLNALYFIGFPKTLSAKARQVFSDPKDKLIFADGKKSLFYNVFDAKYDRTTLVGLAMRVVSCKLKVDS